MRKLCLLLAGLGMWLSAGVGQETIHHASLSGRVLDPSGAAIQGATVTARELETNLESAIETDREGRFRFAYLRVGRCRITVHRDGFRDFDGTVNLSIGAALELPVTLPVEGTTTEITVGALAPLLDTARTQAAGTVQTSELRDLPLNGRNILDAALLIPGVSPTNTASTQLFAETAAVPGQGLSVNSQRNFSNNFLVDGLAANDDAAGLVGKVYGADTVSELQVVTSGAQAEFGRALGGYISMVTKSGGNQIHGDMYGYFRNQSLNAANALSHTALPLTDVQYGASAGGPVVRDRTFYFANFEQRRLNQSGLTTIAPANAATVNAKLAEVGYRGLPVTTGVYPNPVHSTTSFAKIDHQVTSKDQLMVRYSLYDINSRNARGAGGLSAPSASSGLDDTDHSIAVSNIATLSPRVVMETRGQITRNSLAAPPADTTGPAVSIAGVASFGTLSSSPTGRENRAYELVHNVSYQTGAHTFRAGTQFLYNETTILFPRAARGSYSFPSLAAFLAGVYNNSGFTQTFGQTNVYQDNPNVGVYVQDEWRPAQRLTFQAGIRYDVQFLETIRTDRNNVAPRLGFAWAPSASRRTMVRGSYGFFYDRVPLRALANALLSAGNTPDLQNLLQLSVSLSPGQAGAPRFPEILDAPALTEGVRFNLSTMDRDMQNAYAQQGSFEIEHRIGADSTVSVSYQHVRGLHLVAAVNQNVPTCVPSGANNGCRPNPAYANDSRYSPAADSRYDGLHISFLQRPRRGVSFRVSYTWSKALDNAGEFFFSSPMNNYNIWQDYGRSDDDQRHRLVFNGNFQTPATPARTLFQRIAYGFELGVLGQYYSALPFNVTSGVNTIQGTAARPMVNGAYIGRNTGTGFDFFNVNARLSRRFRITERLAMQAIAEAFNLLNHTNGVTLNTVFGTGAYPANPLPQFGQTTAVADPRSMQLALRFSF